MTASEACVLLVDATRDLLVARDERDVYRQIAIEGIHHAHTLWRRLQSLEERHHRVLDELRRLRREAIQHQRAA